MHQQSQLAEGTSKLCRICLDSINGADVISPCKCKGTSAYVHRVCLDKWRSSNKDGRAFEYCNVCQFKYVIEPVEDNPSADRRRLIIFRLKVARDLTLFVLAVHTIQIGLTLLLMYADKQANVIKDLYPSSMNSFGVYYLSSIVLLFALIGVCGILAYACGCMRDEPSPHNNGCTECGSNTCNCVTLSCYVCGDSGGDSDGDASVVVMIIVIIVFAIIGLFIGIGVTVMIVRRIMQHHAQKLWLEQEVKKYVVRDFQDRLHELDETPTNQRFEVFSLSSPPSRE